MHGNGCMELPACFWRSGNLGLGLWVVCLYISPGFAAQFAAVGLPPFAAEAIHRGLMAGHHASGMGLFLELLEGLGCHLLLNLLLAGLFSSLAGGLLLLTWETAAGDQQRCQDP